MVINEKGFKTQFAKLMDATTENLFERNFSDADADAAEEHRIFMVMRKIMEAKSPKDIEDIPLEDVLLCWERQADFASVFDAKKAGHYFSNINLSFPRFKNHSRRRVI